MSDSRIKKFDNFMKISKIRRFLSHMIIEGQKKSWLFGKSIPFELHLYYTPIKNTIVETKIYSSLELKDLNLEFKIGDNISKARDWSTKNGYQITFENNKID